MKKLHTLLMGTLGALMAATALAGEPTSSSWGVAIGGYDSSAYHTPLAVAEHQATPGIKSYSFKWKDTNWRFSSQENYDAFAANPQKYAPAYNGHCANALSLGEGLVETNGKHWEIFEDQLYLFYADRGRERWNDGNWKQYKAVANQAWQDILAKQ